MMALEILAHGGQNRLYRLNINDTVGFKKKKVYAFLDHDIFFKLLL